MSATSSARSVISVNNKSSETKTELCTVSKKDEQSSEQNTSFVAPRQVFAETSSEIKSTSNNVSGKATFSSRPSSNTTESYDISSLLKSLSKPTEMQLSSLRQTTTSCDETSYSSYNPSHFTLHEEARDKQDKQRSVQKSSSSYTFGRTSRNSNMVTPNILSYSAGPSSRTKSSTTPQSSTSFKVVALVEGRGTARGEIGMAYLDLQNPVLTLSQFSDSQAYLRLAVQLNILRPAEVILPHTVMERRSKIIARIKDMFPEIITVTVRRKYFNETKGLQCIQDLCVPEYKTVEIEVSTKYYCLAACAALVKYVEFKQNMSYASHSLRIVYRTSRDTTMISTSTACHLELVTNELDKNEHTLYGILKYTLTPGGDRLLRANILQPPCDINTINTRLDCIAELMDDEDLFNDLKSVIEKFMDTEQMLSLCVQIHKEKNIRNSEQKISNVICLKHSLDLVKPLHTFLARAKNALFQTYYQALSDERFQDLQEKIGLVIHSDTRWQKGTLNMHMQKCFAVKSNINGLLDIARRAYTESVNDVAEIVKQLERQYDLPLTVGYSSVRGFFIQIQRKALPSPVQLPAIFLKVNVFKGIITCTTEDLIKLNDRIKESLNEIYLMSDIIIDEVLNEIREHIGCLYNLTEAVSSIDFLVSLTHACTLSDHVRPEFSDILAIKCGRHPITQKMMGPSYVPNDTFLCEEQNLIVLSGANMSGKTTYLKQVAVLQIMAQIGCYVPAEFASFRIADNILTRMGRDSDIEKNYSTFMLQMKETNFVLQHATGRSLIVMDDLGKDTNSVEGCAIAYAVCEQLLMRKAFTICSTHFVELTELSSVYPNVENYHFRVDYDLNENEGNVCNFSYVLTQGPCKERFYGIKVAELSTLPISVVSEAKETIKNWSEVKSNENQQKIIDDDLKQKIKIAVHLIHASKNDNLDENNLRTHLKELKAEYVDSSPCTISTQSSKVEETSSNNS